MAFHYALADAFTVCDGYHCSFMGSTDPNRYYMWTGWVGNDGSGGGPVLGNEEAGYGWTTYPERLQQAGVSWKIYQDIGDGLDAAGSWGWIDDAYRGNYGDNSLLYFDRYRDATPGDPLYDRARTGTDVKAGDGLLDDLRADVLGGRLPQISWIASPEAFTEHPNWPVNYGAWYTAQVLDALTADPDVWARTALFVTYDENDGFFDHVVPATPHTDAVPGGSTVSTEHEVYTGPLQASGPYGLGQRVPMLVVSPWSAGGWVCSQTLDHTSIIRFMEARFGVHEPNITPWRRAVCGDLTAAFDFSRTVRTVPTLPAVTGYAPPDRERHPDFVPVPPTDPELPTQEPGLRRSRPLGYAFDVTAEHRAGAGSRLELRIDNPGRLGVQLQGRVAGSDRAPSSWTVGAHDSLTGTVAVDGDYDVTVHGPNGFFRRWAGPAAAAAADGVEVTSRARRGARHLELTLTASADTTVTLTDAHTRSRRRIAVRRGRPVTVAVALYRTAGWYDVTLTGRSGLVRQLAGRVETGRASTSDPLLSR